MSQPEQRTRSATCAALPGRWLAALGDAEMAAGLGQPGRIGGRALTLRDRPDDVHPAVAAAGRLTVLFDGPLHNRGELRARLGLAADTDAATLVLQAYRRWGAAAVEQIRGSFALVIWDADQELLLGVRDRLGLYPLFYAQVGDAVLLAPAIESLLEHPLVPRTLNRVAIAEHLCHRWTQLEETFFAQIRRVPPGHMLLVARGRLRCDRYWEPASSSATGLGAASEQLAGFDASLARAVSRCLDDGPVGIYLSGGLDSVTIAAVAAELCGQRQGPAPWALSLDFPGDDEERTIQRSVATSLGLPQIMLPFAEAVGPQGLLRAALTLSSQLAMPLLNTWLPAYHQLGVAGRDRGCRGILTGNGGDEWLGVSPYLAADLLRAGHMRELWQLWTSLQRSYRFSRPTLLRSVLWTFGMRPLLAQAAHRVLRGVAPGVWRSALQRHIAQTTPAWAAPDPALRQQMDDRLAAQAIQSIGQAAQGFYLREMRSALEHPLVSWEMEELFRSGQMIGARVLQPYWDADLIELLYRMPPSLLSTGGRSKGLLRQMLARRFPALRLELQKKIDATDFYRALLLREGAALWQTMGGAAALTDLGIVRPSARAAALPGRSAARQAYQSWDMLNVEAWLRAHA